MNSMTSEPEALYGRSVELELITEFLALSRDRGGARLLRGEPGVGKTVLLDVAAERAQEAGLTVLRATGSEFEADISYSCLNQLLCNQICAIEALRSPMSEVLSVALG